MTAPLLVFYGSYLAERTGIRLARYLVDRFNARGTSTELVDAKEINLPFLERRFAHHAQGEAPDAMAALGAKIIAAPAFVFATGEYNWGPQPGLKNLTDHYLEEWFWRPAAIASYSPGRIGGARANMAWRPILSEMGMIVTSSTLTVGEIHAALDPDGKPIGEGGAVLEKTFPRFADDLMWWAEAAAHQHQRRKPPY